MPESTAVLISSPPYGAVDIQQKETRECRLKLVKAATSVACLILGIGGLVAAGFEINEEELKHRHYAIGIIGAGLLFVGMLGVFSACVIATRWDEFCKEDEKDRYRPCSSLFPY